MIDSRRRSFVKTITWRLIAVSIAIVAFFIITGDISYSIGIAVTINLFSMIAYYFHERFWEKVSWGRNKK